MTILKVKITDENDVETGSYNIECVDRPGIDGKAYDSAYTIDLIRVAAEKHRYLSDFPNPPELSFESITYDMSDPVRMIHLYNVNELWFEVQNLLFGARFNFATARMFKELEDGHNSSSQVDLNARFELHLDKLERFNLGVYELARIEDLTVRVIYEFFGQGFIDVDPNREGWEKKLTWNAMRDALNKRGNAEKGPHPAVESMDSGEYAGLIGFIRSYRSPEVLQLTSYRDRRTHRVAPTVDHAALGVALQSIPSEQNVPLFTSPNSAEFNFLELYSTARDVYEHLLRMLVGINRIIHA